MFALIWGLNSIRRILFSCGYKIAAVASSIIPTFNEECKRKDQASVSFSRKIKYFTGIPPMCWFLCPNLTILITITCTLKSDAWWCLLAGLSYFGTNCLFLVFHDSINILGFFFKFCKNVIGIVIWNALL